LPKQLNTAFAAGCEPAADSPEGFRRVDIKAGLWHTRTIMKYGFLHCLPLLLALTVVTPLQAQALRGEAGQGAAGGGGGGRGGGGGGRGGGRGAAGGGGGQASAPIDLTGYWVSEVTEDWRYRMVTPPKGEYGGVSMTAAGMQIARAWDPAKDQADGNACKPFGAAGVMRQVGFLHITWADASTMKVELSAGTQTRELHFGTTPMPTGDPTWQGFSVAEWENAAGARGGPRTGNMKVVTTHMKSGYVRLNGVPYSANAVLTEWWDMVTTPDKETLLNITTEVNDPQYLSGGPFVVTTFFKKLPDGVRFKPEPCATR
jgi:hypothetical protein